MAPYPRDRNKASVDKEHREAQWTKDAHGKNGEKSPHYQESSWLAIFLVSVAEVPMEGDTAPVGMSTRTEPAPSSGNDSPELSSHYLRRIVKIPLPNETKFGVEVGSKGPGSKCFWPESRDLEY